MELDLNIKYVIPILERYMRHNSKLKWIWMNLIVQLYANEIRILSKQKVLSEMRLCEFTHI